MPAATLLLDRVLDVEPELVVELAVRPRIAGTARGGDTARRSACHALEAGRIVSDPGYGVSSNSPTAVVSERHAAACSPSCGAARPRQLVVLGAPVVVGHVPLGLDPAATFEPVKRGIERALLHLQDVAGNLMDAFGDRPAVLRLERNGLENQQIERSLRQLDPCRRRSRQASPSASTGAYRNSCRSTREVSSFKAQVSSLLRLET